MSWPGRSSTKVDPRQRCGPVDPRQRSILDKGNELLPAAHTGVWSHFVQECADGPHHVDISSLAQAPDGIALTHSALFGRDNEGASMIVHIQPVANVLTF